MVIRLTEQARRTKPGTMPSYGIPIVYITSFIPRQRENIFPRLQNAQTGSGAHSASYCQGLRGYRDRGVTLTPHLHPVPPLKGAIQSQLN